MAGRKASICIAAALLALSTSACMTATPYQPETTRGRAPGGYSEERLAEDGYRVHFTGNNLTSRDRVEGYLLYRAAELTLQNGYDRFEIVDRLTERDTETYVHPDPRYRPYYGAGYGYWRPHWRYYQPVLGWSDWHPEWGAPFWTETVNTQTVEHFHAHAEIVMGRGAVTAGERRAFDARSVIADLEPTIVRPEADRR